MEFQPSQHETNRRGRGISNVPRQMIPWLAALILLIAAGGTAAYYVKKYNDSQKEVKRLSNPQQVAKDQTKELLDKVGKLTVLPTNETPTIATVTDINKLKDQAFFANAQNGDKVLIYTKNKKAILYRPSTNKIINIAPVNIGKGSTKTSGTTTQSSTSSTTPTIIQNKR
jgi:hypothetical protein